MVSKLPAPCRTNAIAINAQKYNLVTRTPRITSESRLPQIQTALVIRRPLSGLLRPGARRSTWQVVLCWAPGRPLGGFAARRSVSRTGLKHTYISQKCHEISVLGVCAAIRCRHRPVILRYARPKYPDQHHGYEGKKCLEKAAVDFAIRAIANVHADDILENLAESKGQCPANKVDLEKLVHEAEMSSATETYTLV